MIESSFLAILCAVEGMKITSSPMGTSGFWISRNPLTMGGWGLVNFESIGDVLFRRFVLELSWLLISFE